MFGLKFVDSEGVGLLAVGMIDDTEAYDYQDIGIKEIEIEANERLLGVRSGQSDNKGAAHHFVQFLIGKMV